jgi:hypothetical protein
MMKVLLIALRMANFFVGLYLIAYLCRQLLFRLWAIQKDNLLGHNLNRFWLTTVLIDLPIFEYVARHENDYG